MTDVRSIVDSWFEPNERHPGHPDQKVHGNWKKKLADKALGGHGVGDDFKPGKPSKTDVALGGHGVGSDFKPGKPKAVLGGSSKDHGVDIGKLIEGTQFPHPPKSDDDDDESAWGKKMPKKAAPRRPRPKTGPAHVPDPNATGPSEASGQWKAMSQGATPSATAVKPPRRPRKSKAPQPGTPEWDAAAAKVKADFAKTYGMKPEDLGWGKPPRADGLNYSRGYTDPADAQQGSPGDPIRFTASTPGVKRDGLNLRANGWRLDNFHRSPVFQWCHDKTMPPLGRVEASAGATLDTLVMFDQQDEFARKVESKYRRGFLHAVSVGWDFVDGSGTRLNTGRLSLDEIRDRAFYDLTELSGVPVPADPDALMARQRSGLRSLSRELAALYDEQEHGAALAAEVRQAVDDELDRLGIPIPLLRQAAAHLQPARKAGFFMPTNAGPADTGITPEAAQDLLAAFTLQGAK